MAQQKPIDGDKLMEAIGYLLQENIKLAAIKSGVPKKSRLIQTLKFESANLSNETITVLLNDYFRFVELGRRKGARLPPTEPILDWLIRYRIAPGREKQIVFAVRRAISNKGIKARPFLNNALTATVNEAEETLQAEFQSYIKSLIFDS